MSPHRQGGTGHWHLPSYWYGYLYSGLSCCLPTLSRYHAERGRHTHRICRWTPLPHRRPASTDGPAGASLARLARQLGQLELLELMSIPSRPWPGEEHEPIGPSRWAISRAGGPGRHPRRLSGPQRPPRLLHQGDPPSARLAALSCRLRRGLAPSSRRSTRTSSPSRPWCRRRAGGTKFELVHGALPGVITLQVYRKLTWLQGISIRWASPGPTSRASAASAGSRYWRCWSAAAGMYRRSLTTKSGARWWIRRYTTFAACQRMPPCGSAGRSRPTP